MNKFGVFCFAIVLVAISHVQANPLLKRTDAAQYENYVNCVEDMQNNCEKSAAPFEVLIQGPSGSRFVRSLVLADANEHKAPIDPTQVSTISVFQPNGNRKLSKRHAKPDLDDDVAEALAASVGSDAATIDEKTVSDQPASGTTDANQKDEPKVGLALPIAPLLGLKGPLIGLKALNIAGKLIPLKLAAQAALNPGLNPITNPVLNPLLNPGILPAKIAALKAKVGLGLLPLTGPLPIVPPIL